MAGDLVVDPIACFQRCALQWGCDTCRWLNKHGREDGILLTHGANNLPSVTRS